MPEVLCVHVKRFRFDAYFSTKISRHIKFPLAGLEMGRYLQGESKGRTEKYNLDAVINHIGGAGGESKRSCKPYIYTLLFKA